MKAFAKSKSERGQLIEKLFLDAFTKYFNKPKFNGSKSNHNISSTYQAAVADLVPSVSIGEDSILLEELPTEVTIRKRIRLQKDGWKQFHV